MADFQQLLDQAAAAPATFGVSPVLNDPILAGKKGAVAQATAEKKSSLATNSPTAAIPDFYSIAAGMGNNRGNDSMGEIESDLRTLTPYEVYMKHGDQGLSLLSQAAEGGTQFYKDQVVGANRTLDEAVRDSTTGALSTGVGGLLSLGALGVTAVDDEAGAWASGKIRDGMDWVNSGQSNSVNAARRVSQTKSALDARDSAAEYEADIASGESDVTASMKRWGRDVINTVANAAEDSTAFAQGTAEATGSLLAGGPLAKGLKVIGNAALKTAGISNTGRLATLGSKAAWPASTAGLEGGGAFTGTVDEVMGMEFSELAQNSPDYNRLISEGMTPEQARVEVATDAGMRAAAVQSSIAALTAGLTRFAETPFKVPSVGSAARNVLVNEPLEELVQSTTGQLAQNEAIQQFADENKVLVEGVGEQSALGAIYGFSSAGTVQAPGAAVRGTVEAGKMVYQAGRASMNAAVDAGMPYMRALAERGRQKIQAEEKASPIADSVMAQAAAVVNAEAPQTMESVQATIDASQATPEQKAAGTDYATKLVNAMAINPNELGELPPAQMAVMNSAANRIDAIQKLAAQVNDATNDQDRMLSAAVMNAVMSPITDLREDDPEILNDPELSQLLAKMQGIVANVENSPAVRRALRQINEIAAKQQESGVIQPVTEASLDTVEGQQNVRNAITVAELHPDKGNLDANENILTHAANGKLELTPGQLRALQASVGLLRARAKMEKAIAESGLTTAKDVVSSQVVAGNDPLRKIAMSALQHTKGVLSAMRGNNSDLGQARLEDFGLFVTHMQNKVAALNQSFAMNGERIQYAALQPTEERDFKLSRDGMFVNTKSPKSLEAAQSIALEASILSDVYNGLVSTFPELNLQPITAVALNAELQGDVREVARKFHAQAKTNVQEVNTQAAEPTRTTESEAEPVSSGTETVNEEERPRTELKSEEEMLADRGGLRPDLTQAQYDAAVIEAERTIDGNMTIDEEPAITNKQWMTGKVQELRSDDGRARITVGDTTISYDREGDTINLNLIQTARGKTGTGSARRAMNKFLELTDAAGVTVDLTVAEQSEGTNRDGLVRFYSSFGFTGEGDSMSRAVGAEPVVSTPVEATPVVSTETPTVGSTLFEGARNMFNAAFSEPTEAKTNIHGEISPAATVARALSSKARFAGMGVKSRNTLTPEIIDAYERMLGSDGLMSELLRGVQKNLQSFLSSPYSKAVPTPKGEIFRDGIKIKREGKPTINGSEMNRFQNGKVLNLVEQVGEGFQYSQRLLEQAGLATMQWLLSANNYQSVMDAQDLADMVGVDVLYASELPAELREGMSTEQAVRSLAQKISNYWGMDRNKNVDDAYVEGIPQSMAAEMLRGLQDIGILEIKKVTITKERMEQYGVEDPTQKDFNRFIPMSVNENSPLLSFVDAIETVVMKAPEHTNYFGDEKPDVAQRQMNNPEVANTADQKDALAKEQETPFYLNRMMVNFFTSMGKQNLLSLFGTTVVDPKDWNANHLKSIEGQNRTIEQAFNHMQDVVADLENTARTLGREAEDVAVRYAYNMSRVGRMQMLGKYSPQASKLMREAFLPTRTTLDMTDPEINNHYMLGLAQDFGVKVHNLSVTDSLIELNKMLDSMETAIGMLQEWHNDPVEFNDDQMQALREGFEQSGADLTMAALHSIVDYARYIATEDKTKYTTSVYLEADGVTNGPINAMALMTIGNFSEEWMENIEKGGLSIGPAKTMAEIRERNRSDLYQTSTDATRHRLSQLRTNLAKQKQGAFAIEQQTHLLNLMSLFNSDIIFDPDKAWDEGGLQMKRGIAKNPLTITVYGSGAAGIGNKLVNAVVDEIYARMSMVVQAQKADPSISVADAMFPNDLDAADKLAKFQAAYTALTTNVASKRRGEIVFEYSPTKDRGFNPQLFTMETNEFKAFSSNMLQLFVEPMRQGIEDTVGPRLIKAVGLLRDATQVQSVIYHYEYMKAMSDLMDDRAENDANWRQGDFLSQADREKIAKGLSNVAPLIKTGDQTFMVSGNEKVEINGTDVTVGAALNSTIRTGPSAYAPSAAGVRGIPMLTIGMGDGMMMQWLAQVGLQGTLKIFDGMNMPLDKIKEYSQLSNEAVYESWKGNPLAEVAKSYASFLKNYKADSINEFTRDALIQTLFDPQERYGDAVIDDSDIIFRMEEVLKNLEWSAKSIDARHKAMQAMPVSLDQMAAAGAPYVNGKPATDEMNIRTATIELNRLYDEFMAEPSPMEVQKPAAPVEPTVEVDAPARQKSPKTAKVLTWANMPKAFKNATDAQKDIWGELRRSLAAKEYQVVMGSVEQLDAYIDEHGLQARPNQELFGWTNIGEKTIYMVNPTTETLVHELVHASSYETILDHYNGTSTPDVKVAVQALEDLMADFLDIDMSGMTPEMRVSYTSARSAIMSANLESDQAVAQAKALNEFMAWGLTNQQLTKDLKERKAPKIVQLVKSVVNMIKKLIWGRRKAPEYADDFLSNLQFYSGMIFRTQPSIAQIARQGELFHAASYGTSSRLQAVRRTFGQKIIDYIADDKYQRGQKMRTTEVSQAQMDAIDIALVFNAHGFSMTPQESLTFRMIVAALATEAEIDPNALARAQELYAHVVKNLTPESFMADPESLNPADRYYAQEKYDAIVGKHIQKTDAKGRSSLLPAFLALATVSDEFRDVLKTMELPKSEKNKERTLDALLENLGNTTMDSLSARLAGDANSSSALNSIDNLLTHIRDVARDEQSLLDKFASRSGGMLDSLNTYVKEGMEKLSDLAMEKASETEKNSKNAMVRTAARWSQTLAAVVSEKNGMIVAEQTMVMLNKSKVWEPVHKLMADLVGRTSSNALVYDMIKMTRSMVQQVRQQFREETPRIIMSKFKGKMDDSQWTSMFNAMGKTDLAVLRDTMTHADVQTLFSNQTALDTEIDKLESVIQANDTKHWSLLQTKMKQLARFMNTGIPGKNLLRNAHSVSLLYGESVARGYKQPSAAMVKNIDKLITLYAVESLSEADKKTMASLVQNEVEGVSFSLDYLVGQRKEETAKAAGGKALINAYKGFIPSERETGVNLMVADDANFVELKQKGFTRVADYNGSSTERTRTKMGYYYAPINGRAIFNQGIMQNVRHTAGGVDAVSGFTVAQLAGRVTDRYAVRKLAVRMQQETNEVEALMPVYNDYGQVVALERPLDPVQAERAKPSRHLPRMIGVWRGRQMEEGLSQFYNEALIDNLKKMYDEDMQQSSSNQSQYVNLLSPKEINSVQQDAVNLFTDQTLDYIREKFGDEFWVRRDMLDDAIGYRAASVGDFWTGNTRWSDDTQDMFKHAMAGLFGVNAYRFLVKAEQIIQNFMADARTLIVIKSVVVPMLNFLSNMYQLVSRGVPMLHIIRSMPKKLGEIDSFTKTNLRAIDAEAELRAAAGNPILERKLKAEIRSIEDSHRRLSIWPLIEAGEFSTVADVGQTSEDLELSSGRFVQRIEKWVDSLPESVRNAGRYALITRDTALFQGLQKSVQYGDFIAKAVLYDDLTKRQKMPKAQALARITEEFVNYDRLPGRFRSYLENMGLLWFYNFKIRISKVAVSTIRNNPVHALVAMALPTPDFLGTVGLPFQDSLVSKAAEGTLDFSMGPEMGLRAPFLNPWWNLVN